MTEDADVHQALGDHAARLSEIERWRERMEDRLNARLDAQDAKLDAHGAKLDRITSILDHLSGGWKLIVILGAGLALLSDGAFRIFSHLIGK